MTTKNQHVLVGETIEAVDIAEDKLALRFRLSDGREIVARVDGDCCSSTWIESLDDPEALLGTVTEVADIEMPDLGSPGDDEYIAYYGCRIATNRGVCVIDYRNSSNGYYGGNLHWPSDRWYYGGVYGQNISAEQWLPLVPNPEEA